MVGTKKQMRIGLRRSGFTLVELIAVVAMMSILLGLALKAGGSVSERAKVRQAIADVLVLQTRIDEFSMVRNALPRSLAEVGAEDMKDPWGNPYYFLAFAGTKGKEGGGQPRKDRFLVPINSLYDLYSAGADGETMAPLTAKASRDDIVRANDGAFIGLAVEF